MSNRITRSRNKSIFKMVKGRFAQDKMRLASHPDTAPDVLQRLTDKNEPSVLERVAENSQTAPDTLEQLSSNDSADVRSAVTENKNTPSETLRLLAADENPDVRYRIAENPETPALLLETLAGDHNPYVGARAQETLDHMRSLSQRADEMLVEECFVEAEDLYLKLVAGLEQLLGSQHHEVELALHKLAAAQSAQGKDEEAEASETRANLIQAARDEQT